VPHVPRAILFETDFGRVGEEGTEAWAVGVDVGEVGIGEVGVEDGDFCVADVDYEGLGCQHGEQREDRRSGNNA